MKIQNLRKDNNSRNIVESDTCVLFLIIFCLGYFFLGIYFFLNGLQDHNSGIEQSLDSFMNFIALSFMIYAGVKGKQILKTVQQPFGFSRLETLSAFSMTLFILIVALSNLMRMVHHILEESEYIQKFNPNHNEVIDLFIYFSNQLHNQNINLNYLYIKLVFSVTGALKFIDYSFYSDNECKFIQKNGNYFRFIKTYQDILPNIVDLPYYDQHYLNFHAVFLFFLQELIFTVGQCFTEFMQMYFNSKLTSPLILMINIYLIWVLLLLFNNQKLTRPLMMSTAFALLVACDVERDFQQLIYRLKHLQGVKDINLKAWGSTSIDTKEALVSIIVMIFYIQFIKDQRLMRSYSVEN